MADSFSAERDCIYSSSPEGSEWLWIFVFPLRGGKFEGDRFRWDIANICELLPLITIELEFNFAPFNYEVSAADIRGIEIRSEHGGILSLNLELLIMDSIRAVSEPSKRNSPRLHGRFFTTFRNTFVNNSRKYQIRVEVRLQFSVDEDFHRERLIEFSLLLDVAGWSFLRQRSSYFPREGETSWGKEIKTNRLGERWVFGKRDLGASSARRRGVVLNICKVFIFLWKEGSSRQQPLRRMRNEL